MPRRLPTHARRGALPGLVALLAPCALALGSCVTAPREGGPAPEDIGSAIDGVSLGCSDNTFNAPCDPDGFGGSLGECEGVCRLDLKGAMQCVAVTKLGGVPSDLDGRLCGTPSSNGCGLFGRICQKGKCSDPNGPGNSLPDGIPCQMNAASHLCAGACKGGWCQGLGNNACPYGRGAVGAATHCSFATCDPGIATSCVNLPLAKTTLCDDGSVCTQAPDSCDGLGACSGPPLSCDDGAACTVDGCDAKTGCTHANAPDGASCADGDPCNGAETCQAGACSAGLPLACDDGNPCTADACVKPIGCVNVPVQDGLACPDGNACNGFETCIAGACAKGAPLDCDDGDPCTQDTCDKAKGCVHAVGLCGDAGAGGSGGHGGAGGFADAGAGGGAGALGDAGSGGSAGGFADAGSGGSGGGFADAGNGGSAGGLADAGTGGSAGGFADAGSGGSGGGLADAGTGGSAVGFGDAGTGGSAGSGGTTGSGGHTAAGGHGGATSTSGSGASSTGSGGATAAPLGRAPLEPSETGGCGCRVAEPSTPKGAALFGALACAALIARRRRAKARGPLFCGSSCTRDAPPPTLERGA